MSQKASDTMRLRRGTSDAIAFAGVAVLVVIIGGLLLAYVSSESSGAATTSSPSSTTTGTGSASSESSATSQPASPGGNSAAVSIPSGAGNPSGAPGYSPDVLNVTTGTTVVWTNDDSVHHTVTSVTGNGTINSPDMPPGATFSFTFNTPGTYDYICTYHSWMKGTVVVTGSPVVGSNSTSSSTTSSVSSSSSSSSSGSSQSSSRT